MNKNTQKIVIVAAIVVAAIAVVILTITLSNHAPSYSTEAAARRDITQVVRATGTIVPDQTSSLSFSSQGKIADVRVHAGDVVHKGDVLASLDTRTTHAQLDGATADLTASQAQLSKLQSGARPEELTVYSQKYSDASTALLVAMNNAYLQATDAVSNKVDTFFTNGNSSNPEITLHTDSQFVSRDINNERVALRDKLTAWKTALTNTDTSTSSLTVVRLTTQDSLRATQTFLDHVSAIVNNLSTGNSGLSQATISADTTIINTAQQEVTLTTNSFTTADTAWSTSKTSLGLESAGTRNEDLEVQTAALAKAQAQVEAYQSALSQGYIIAPFDGVITDVTLKVGEVVVPGISSAESIDIISTNVFNIEAYVPQNAIGTMRADNPAVVTLDAYGSGTTFPASVYLVSPAETMKNGVSSYKVTLRFVNADDRIRSGLNANVVITAATATDALAVPTRAIITRNEQKFVLVKSPAGDFKETAVTTGITGSDGYTEIMSGLKEGDEVASI